MQGLPLGWMQGRELRQALVTIGLSIVVADQLPAVYGGTPRQFFAPDAIFGPTRVPGVGGYPTFRLVQIGIAVAVGVGLWLLLNRTKLGMMIRAGVDNREILGAWGVDVPRVGIAVFALGAALAGPGGVIGATAQPLAQGADARFLLVSLVVVTVGGMGSVAGTDQTMLSARGPHRRVVAVHPAYDSAFDGFAAAEVRGDPAARQRWAVEQMRLAARAARASRRLGLAAHDAAFSGALAWPHACPWPQRPAGLIETAFDEPARFTAGDAAFRRHAASRIDPARRAASKRRNAAACMRSGFASIVRVPPDADSAAPCAKFGACSSAPRPPMVRRWQPDVPHRHPERGAKISFRAVRARRRRRARLPPAAAARGHGRPKRRPCDGDLS